MVDLSTNTIRRLFEKQISELTQRSTLLPEEIFDLQFSGEWVREV